MFISIVLLSVVIPWSRQLWFAKMNSSIQISDCTFAINYSSSSEWRKSCHRMYFKRKDKKWKRQSIKLVLASLPGTMIVQYDRWKLSSNVCCSLQPNQIHHRLMSLPNGISVHHWVHLLHDFHLDQWNLLHPQRSSSLSRYPNHSLNAAMQNRKHHTRIERVSGMDYL